MRREPRWAIAYKFPAVQGTTILKEIGINVGRTGSLNPYAILEPVSVGGVTIKHAALHNEEDVRRKDIRIGDTVIIQRAGEVIPEIVGPIVSKRTGEERIFTMPSSCPECGADVIKPEDEAMHRCTNAACPAQALERLKHFVSRGAMDIDKLDHKLILELQNNGRCAMMDLARVLNVAEGTVRNRLKKLVDGGMIKITAVPDLDKFGYDFMGIVGLQVPLSKLRSVAEELSKNSNVCFLANVTGRYDFLAILLTRSSREFADIMEKTVAIIPNVIRTETFVTLNIYKGHKNWFDIMNIIDNLDINM